MSEHKKCPFCGGEPIYSWIKNSACCKKCKCDGPVAFVNKALSQKDESYDIAVEESAWNLWDERVES